MGCSKLRWPYATVTYGGVAGKDGCVTPRWDTRAKGRAGKAKGFGMARHRTAEEKIQLGKKARAKDELRASARAMYAAGQSYRGIQRELGVSRGSLSLWLRDLKGEPKADPIRVLGLGGDSRIARARELRAEGLLLREIAEQLGLSAATIYRWVADLPVPESARHGGDPEHMERMRRAYLDRLAAGREEERRRVLAAAVAEVGQVSARELVLLGVVAYLCEGTKSKPWERRERLTFINSDPGLVRLFMAFLNDAGVDASRLRLTVSIHESADIAAAERFWADVVGVAVERFRPATIKRHNPKTVRHNTGAGYVGCLSISVRQSRELYQRIDGIWQGIMDSVVPPLEASA